MVKLSADIRERSNGCGFDDDFDARNIPPRARNRAARRKSLQQNHQRGGKKNSGFSENRGKDRRKEAQKRR